MSYNFSNMILNEEYYRILWAKFEKTTNQRIFNGNASCLTTNLILEYYWKNKPIHVNFQNSKEILFEIGSHLFVEVANDIYINHYDLPALSKGNKLRDKRKYADGKKHDYIIKSISTDSFVLEHTKNKANLNLKYDDLVKKFIPIEQGTKQSTLQGYTKFFSDLNDGLKLDFTPTKFEQKAIFIAKKPLWDYLPNKNKIPCEYLPSPNDGGDLNPVKSIPALSDSMLYFTPKYNICYQNILLKGEKIKTIIVFDTEAGKIQQMLQDKNKFGFNLIVISNSFSPLKNVEIPCWNWFREELEIINSL